MLKIWRREAHRVLTVDRGVQEMIMGVLAVALPVLIIFVSALIVAFSGDEI